MSSHRYSWKFIVDKTISIMVLNHMILHSHVNPWFGGSIVHFNATLNCGCVANVEFCFHLGNNAIATEIVGKAICDIAKGCELFQEYGESALAKHAGFI